MQEDPFGPTCDWPVMKFGNEPVGGRKFSSLINPQLPN